MNALVKLSPLEQAYDQTRENFKHIRVSFDEIMGMP